MALWHSLWRSLQALRSLRLLMTIIGVAIVIILVASNSPLNTSRSNDSRLSANSTQVACDYHPEVYEGLNLESLETELAGTGLIGRIHGAAAINHLYVLSVREPNNFFAHTEFSLIPSSPEIEASLAQLSRHDLVCIQGSAVANPSAQPHAKVASVRVLESYDALDGYSPYEYELNIPEDLEERGSYLGKVHAIADGGHILVTEYQDGVLPIFIPEGLPDPNLFRGDIVRIAYRQQHRPNQPVHLVLDTEATSPLEVVSSIADWHQQTMTLSGTLVKFPRSPQITLDVYAIEVETEGVKRYFTLVNFEDFDVFQTILAKLADIWDSHQDQVVAGRNLLREAGVTVSATGQIGIISPQQANPQILLDSPTDLEVS